jgi:hypothetical protein
MVFIYSAHSAALTRKILPSVSSSKFSLPFLRYAFLKSISDSLVSCVIDMFRCSCREDSNDMYAQQDNNFLLSVLTSMIAFEGLPAQASHYIGSVAGGACGFNTYALPAGIYGAALSSSNWYEGIATPPLRAKIMLTVKLGGIMLGTVVRAYK